MKYGRQAPLFSGNDYCSNSREKHIDINAIIREQVLNNLIELVCCRTDDMLVDIFTKGLSKPQF